ALAGLHRHRLHRHPQAALVLDHIARADFIAVNLHTEVPLYLMSWILGLLNTTNRAARQDLSESGAAEKRLSQGFHAFLGALDLVVRQAVEKIFHRLVDQAGLPGPHVPRRRLDAI